MSQAVFGVSLLIGFVNGATESVPVEFHGDKAARHASAVKHNEAIQGLGGATVLFMDGVRVPLLQVLQKLGIKTIGVAEFEAPIQGNLIAPAPRIILNS